MLQPCAAPAPVLDAEILIPALALASPFGIKFQI